MRPSITGEYNGPLATRVLAAAAPQQAGSLRRRDRSDRKASRMWVECEPNAKREPPGPSPHLTRVSLGRRPPPLPPSSGGSGPSDGCRPSSALSSRLRVVAGSGPRSRRSPPPRFAGPTSGRPSSLSKPSSDDCRGPFGGSAATGWPDAARGATVGRGRGTSTTGRSAASTAPVPAPVPAPASTPSASGESPAGALPCWRLCPRPSGRRSRRSSRAGLGERPDRFRP